MNRNRLAGLEGHPASQTQSECPCESSGQSPSEQMVTLQLLVESAVMEDLVHRFSALREFTFLEFLR